MTVQLMYCKWSKEVKLTFVDMKFIILRLWMPMRMDFLGESVSILCSKKMEMVCGRGGRVSVTHEEWAFPATLSA